MPQTNTIHRQESGILSSKPLPTSNVTPSRKGFGEKKKGRPTQSQSLQSFLKDFLKLVTITTCWMQISADPACSTGSTSEKTLQAARGKQVEARGKSKQQRKERTSCKNKHGKRGKKKVRCKSNNQASKQKQGATEKKRRTCKQNDHGKEKESKQASRSKRQEPGRHGSKQQQARHSSKQEMEEIKII